MRRAGLSTNEQSGARRRYDRTRASELVRAAQAGDAYCFAEMVRAYQDLATAYAASILRDHQLAEDAAQEAFVDAYRELKSLREPAAFASWFRTIVFKHCDRIIRKRRLLTNPLDSAFDQRSARPSPHEQLESRDAAAGIWEAIGALPAVERTVVLLYYMGEHSQSLVAKFLGITPNTVKVRLYSARRRMREYLTKRLDKSLGAARPSNDFQFSQRVVTAALSLQLSYLDGQGARQAAGSTVAGRRPRIPKSATWLIEPREVLTSEDWDTLIDLMQESHTPGFSGAGQITDEILRRISRCSHLTYLDLQNSNAVTDEGLLHVARLPKLQHLILSGTKITNRGLAIVRHLPHLRTLDICHQQYISDDGMPHVATCDRLERLNLMGTRTGDEAIRAVRGKVRLRQLFAGTNVTDKGLALLDGIPLFATWKGGDHNLSLMNFQHHPTYLWLNMKAPLTNRGLAHLGKLRGLSALNLFATTGHAPFDDSWSEVTPAGLSGLVELRNLCWLGCCARLCTDDAMQHFGSMRRLRFLMCQDAVAGDKGFIAVSRSSSLEYIWGRRCHNLTGAGFLALQETPELRGLAVSCRNVGDRELTKLPDFRKLKEFMPVDVSDPGFKHIGQCKQLEALYCMYCQDTTDEATRRISSLRLKTYQAWSSRITDRSLRMLGKMHSLEHVGFYKCAGITDSGIARLVGLPRLRGIDLEQLPSVTRDAAFLFAANVDVNYAA
jgi:RNA polymerase sigma factor (sigma-70 family)